MESDIASLDTNSRKAAGPMPPSVNDVSTSPDSKATGSSRGLANVFRGLAGSRLTRSPTISQSSSSLSALAYGVAPSSEDAVSSASSVGLAGLSIPDVEAFITLRDGTPSERVGAADTLRLVIASCPQSTVMSIWDAAKDMLGDANTKAVRHAGWQILDECAKNSSITDHDRQLLFHNLSSSNASEDVHLQLATLIHLTNHGRNLAGFEYETIPRLAIWLKDAYEAVRLAKKAAAKDGKEGKTMKSNIYPLGQDANLTVIFDFVLGVVKFNFKVADDAAITSLIEAVLDICNNTSSQSDLARCITVLDAIITYGSIPADCLGRCVEVLSSIHLIVPALEKPSWHTLSSLLRSHNGYASMQTLLKILQDAPKAGKDGKDQGTLVRASLKVIEKLLWKSTQKGYPVIALPVLLQALTNVISTSRSAKTVAAALDVVISLFGDGRDSLHPLLQDDDWTPVFEVVYLAVAYTSGEQTTEKSPPAEEFVNPGEALIKEELARLFSRLEVVLSSTSDLAQQQSCINFLSKVHISLNESMATLLLDYIDEFRCCYPSDPDWRSNLALVTSVCLDRKRTAATRLKALHMAQDTDELLEMTGDDAEVEAAPSLLDKLLSSLDAEDDNDVLQETIDIIVRAAVSADEAVFGQVERALNHTLSKRPQSSARRSSAPIMSFLQLTEEHQPVTAPSGSPRFSPAAIITRGCVKIFMQTMDVQGHKAKAMYDILAATARNSLSTSARLAAMRMLFRLRADWAHRVYLISKTDSEGLGDVLLRAQAVKSGKQADGAFPGQGTEAMDHAAFTRTAQNAASNQPSFAQRMVPSRHASAAHVSSAAHRVQWMLPDEDALPQTPNAGASPVLTVRSDENEPDTVPMMSLDVATWLETVIHCLTHEGDWEAYSFCLVHLSSQLSNHALFVDAKQQILELRRVLSERTRTSTLQEPPNASGVKRADVSICAFQTLTTLVSYRQLFSKSDEDDLIRTFIQGIAHQTARTCIHALTICCHELPAATARGLVTALGRMSSVITSSFVAMHILEFLAGLSRMPALYSNWREDEYRIVFGMCFRYLDAVRDKKRAVRNNTLSEPSTPASALTPSYETMGVSAAMAEDLPQYVYSLAHHVIVHWFLALRLPDRAKHVGWITKRLLVDADSGLASDEQAMCTIDLMQRSTYADIDESCSDPQFLDRGENEITERSWLVGNSIMSIQQAKGTPWVQMIKRQPTGTSYFLARESLRPRPAHQVNYEAESIQTEDPLHDTSLPRHLMVQLLSTVPSLADVSMRPIPLPGDETLTRAIRSFDRIPVVDGHKVGIIYIGEGQSDQNEILANVAGSRDYVTFLNRIGTLTRLKGADFNTQGLDREFDTDGQFTYAWRDRVTEIVFHVTTQMPTNLEHDKICINKKKHIGNDFVNIIFNDSGLPFNFDTFPSDFSYVYIVISPEARATFVSIRERASATIDGDGDDIEETGALAHESFFKVQVLSRDGFPDISPAAATKMVSLTALPDFVRMLALNASVFCLVWANRASGEYPSSWRSRLREISRLCERYKPKQAVPVSHPPVAGSGVVASTSLGGNLAGIGSAHSNAGHNSHHSMISTTSSASSPLSHAGTGVTDTTSSSNTTTRPNSSIRDSFQSMRRASVATFLTTTSAEPSYGQRTSMLSLSGIASGGRATNGADADSAGHVDAIDQLVDALDFTKWA